MNKTLKQLTKATLGQYIRQRLGERSVRALAAYAKIGVGTANNLVNDVGMPDPKTLLKVAEYLNEPPENLFRLAYFPEEPDRERAARLVIHLFAQLPEDRQRRILEMIKLELKMEREEQTR